MKPVVKWAGGKSRIMPALTKRFPDKIEDYYEPFVGGGSVLLEVIERFGPKNVTINDINGELINMYEVIRDQPKKLIQLLETFQREYDSFDEGGREGYFYGARETYNHIRGDGKRKVLRAALFIFLNRTDINGLYRVNKNGDFNVSWGKKDRFVIDTDNILEVSEMLKGVEMKSGDYPNIMTKASGKKSFVYLDPPYYGTFAGYSSQGFDEPEQIELAKHFRAADKRGAKLMESNSYDTKFFPRHYGGYKLDRIESATGISPKASGRGKTYEYVIRNYKKKPKKARKGILRRK